ncbi:MAG TPA: ABC transporter ATP-binding protein [Deferrisomatales bacterium]|nr:ABC transporter ATP-binding protein [Deferrisomatales bacterium]
MSGPLFGVEALTGFLEGSAGLRRILDRVSLEVRPGQPLSLLGESGSGKTFLVQSALGLHRGVPGVVAGRARVLGVEVFAGLTEGVVYREDAGAVRIAKDTAGWNRQVAARLRPVVGAGVTLVPQDPATSLPPFHRVGQLLARALRRGKPELSASEVVQASRGWLERVHMYGVEEVLHSYPHELSGGMAQRVALALALAPGPELLVADEPTTGLDATLRVRILELLSEVAEGTGVTLFLITHDTEAARLLTREVAVLCAGRIVEQGPVTTVLNPRHPTKHPYTRYLLEAEGWLAGATDVAPPLPQTAQVDGGCGYRGVCPDYGGGCAAAVPELEVVAGAAGEAPHRIACWRNDS